MLLLTIHLNTRELKKPYTWEPFVSTWLSSMLHLANSLIKMAVVSIYISLGTNCKGSDCQSLLQDQPSVDAFVVSSLAVQTVICNYCNVTSGWPSFPSLKEQEIWDIQLHRNWLRSNGLHPTFCLIHGIWRDQVCHHSKKADVIPSLHFLLYKDLTPSHHFPPRPPSNHKQPASQTSSCLQARGGVNDWLCAATPSSFWIFSTWCVLQGSNFRVIQAGCTRRYSLFEGIGFVFGKKWEWWNNFLLLYFFSGKQTKIHLSDEEMSEVIDVEQLREKYADSIERLKEDYIKNLTLRTASGKNLQLNC